MPLGGNLKPPSDFGFTMATLFPFGVKTAHTLKIREPHVITVTGKAFYDTGHAPADHSNGEVLRKVMRCGKFIW